MTVMQSGCERLGSCTLIESADISGIQNTRNTAWDRVKQVGQAWPLWEGLNHRQEKRPLKEQRGFGMNMACTGDSEGVGLAGGLGGTAEEFGVLILGKWGRC